VSVVVSGAGAACAVGTGCEALWQALSEGRDGLLPVRRFAVEEFKTRLAGLWPQWNASPAPEGRAALELALPAAREAMAHARAQPFVEPKRTAVLVGTCFAENLTGFSELAQRLAAELGACGPAFIVSTACSSSTTAVGLGRDLLERGEADLVLAGGVDVMTREVFAGFHAIGVMAEGKCAPFGDTVGLTLGEGAGFVVLEREAQARRRAVEPLAYVLGYGLSADAHHETAPDPSGSGVRRAILAALQDAGGGGVDFVSAHGTGTDSNDAAEWTGIETALGAATPALSATKSLLGHAQGAAGVLELIATLLCMRRGLVPPSLRAVPRRAGIGGEVITGDRPQPRQVRRALKLSAAFGGANAALIIGRSTEPRQVPERRRVFAAGASALGPHGLTLAELEVAASNRAPLRGGPPNFELSTLLRSAPERGVDPSGRCCAAAVALALADAKLTVRGAARERAGLFLGSTRMPPRSVRDTEVSIEKRGVLGVAAVPFTQMVLNAPAGTAAKLLSLKGPLLALSAAQGSGLFAIARAAEHLASRRCADLLVAGAIDERPVRAAEQHVEAGAFAVLVAESPHPRRGPFDAAALRAGGRGEGKSIELLGWGLAGPQDMSTAISAAMHRCPEVDGVISAGPFDDLRVPLGVIDLSAVYGGAEATVSALAFVLAVSRIRSGQARRLLVLSASASLCCAVVVGGIDGQ
jgi:3-oxoacyl-[acyl-carrier-protein] synthase II